MAFCDIGMAESGQAVPNVCAGTARYSPGSLLLVWSILPRQSGQGLSGTCLDTTLHHPIGMPRPRKTGRQKTG